MSEEIKADQPRHRGRMVSQVGLMGETLGRQIRDLSGKHAALSSEVDDVGQYLVDRALVEHQWQQRMLGLVGLLGAGVWVCALLLLIGLVT